MDQVHKYIRAVFCNQLALDANEDLRFSNPEVFIRSLKQKHNLFLQELIKSEKNYDELFYNKNVEKQVTDVYAAIELLTKEISNVPIQEFGELAEIVRAYKKDAKSILGIAKKINR